MIITEQYGRFFRLAYDYMARWQPCPANPDAWIAAAQDIGKTSESGGNNPFLMDLLTAVIEELERQYKAKEQGKEGQQLCG